MVLVRRIYVYLICAVSLFVLAMGLTNLLELAIDRVWDALGGAAPILENADDIRREVSLYLALIAVSLPIWLLHWYLAERWAALDYDDTDRGSGMRAIFLAVVLGVAAGVWISYLGELLSAAFSRFLDGGGFYPASQVIGAMSILIVSLGIWFYHAAIRDRDLRSLGMSGAGVWPVRVYLYVAAFAGAMLLLTGVAQLLTLAVDAVVGEQEVVSGEAWWSSGVVTALPLVIVGFLVWGIHWTYSLWLIYGNEWWALSERSSALRRAYLYVVALTGVAVTLVGVSLSLTELLREVFGVEPGLAADPLWARLLDPLLIALPFALFWLMHQRLIGQEANQFASQPEQVSVARLYTYVISFLALAFAAVGLAYLLGVLIEFAFESARVLDTDPEWVPEQISQFLSITLIGALVWIWHWLMVQRRAVDDPVGERSSTSRRVYIYLVLTGTTLATLVALAVVLYEALQIILGVRTTEGIASDVGSLIGVVLVAGSLLVYHVLILREDLAISPRREPAPAGTSGEPGAVLTLPLLLRGPNGAELEAMLSDLRRRLPEGMELVVDDERQVSREPASSRGFDQQETAQYELPDDDDPNATQSGPRIFS